MVAAFGRRFVIADHGSDNEPPIAGRPPPRYSRWEAQLCGNHAAGMEPPAGWRRFSCSSSPTGAFNRSGACAGFFVDEAAAADEPRRL
jgi:hypothetical protein